MKNLRGPHVLGFILLTLGGTLALQADPPVQPGWWQTKHVIKAAPATANDYAAANQGQLKNMVISAYEHLLENIPATLDGIGSLETPVEHPPKGGTGYRLQTLVSQWVVIDPATGRLHREELKPNGEGTGEYSILGTGAFEIPAAAKLHNDYRIINRGQLKAVALPFYDRLTELYRTPSGTSFFAGGLYPKPWNDTAADRADYAAANLGHLKNVFNFDLLRDADGDTVSDIQELIFNHDTTGSQILNPFNGHSDGVNSDATYVVPGVPPFTLSATGYATP